MSQRKKTVLVCSFPEAQQEKATPCKNLIFSVFTILFTTHLPDLFNRNFPAWETRFVPSREKKKKKLILEIPDLALLKISRNLRLVWKKHFQPLKCVKGSRADYFVFLYWQMFRICPSFDREQFLLRLDKMCWTIKNSLRA